MHFQYIAFLSLTQCKHVQKRLAIDGLGASFMSNMGLVIYFLQ
jgi:hypothetical protein